MEFFMILGMSVAAALIVALLIGLAWYIFITLPYRRVRGKPLTNPDIKAIQPLEIALVIDTYFQKGYITNRGQLEDFLYFWEGAPYIPDYLDSLEVAHILDVSRRLRWKRFELADKPKHYVEPIGFLRDMFTRPK